MWYGRISSKRGGLTASVAAAALVLAGVPTASFAIDALGSSERRPGLSGFAFTPASVDPKLAKFVAERAIGSNRPMRFTPAGVAERGSRSVTVAVRVDEETAQAISVRSAVAAAREQMSANSAVRIAPVRYNLGLSRGYESFAQAPELSRKLTDAAIPDLASFKPRPGVKEEPSRFGARIALEQEEKTASAPRTHDALGDQTLDVAGSYRLTRNLDVTAGVRYSQERDRLTPMTDPETDSQAVYVGTQFRF